MNTRGALPILALASLFMVLIVVWSNWLMQGGPLHPDGFTLPQPFTWLNNLTGQDPLGGVFIYGQFTFPIAFLITDIINRVLGPNRAWYVIAVGVVFGGIASFYWAGASIAMASISAFVVGQVLDVLLFQSLRQRSWYLAPLISSLIASLIDTLLFYGLAFGLADSWGFMTVDFGVKVFVAVIALLPFRLIIAAYLGNRRTK